MNTCLSLASPRWPIRWNWFTKTLAAFALTSGTLYAPTAAAQGMEQCSTGGIASETGWSVLPDLTGVTNGRAIAENTLGLTINATDTAPGYKMVASTIAVGVNSAKYNTIPLNSIPGLGVRLSWAGYVDLSNAPLTGPVPPPKVVTTIESPFIESTFGGSYGSKSYKLLWKIEVVMTDLNAYVSGYAGSNGNIGSEAGLDALQVLPTVEDNVPPNPKRQSCNPTLSGFRTALAAGGAIALPKMPVPPKPTCQFPTFATAQTVNLNPESTGSVSAQGSPRSAGASNETLFNLKAENCEANTSYAIYFTDANEPGSTKDFLKTTGSLAGKVNVRLYQGGSTTPVAFGPAPSGSALPSYAAGVTNAATPANSTFSHPFFAQYVRVDGVNTSDMVAGTLAAQATVTVVYP
ncbi:fimbrial protein [Achromobacter aegrifaciens]|uniref:fimbrial protein n=1 Tax=Achromobacter aegrifaciens TaxID=1287736 RepID=UPI0027BADAD5|nr:fimbrial protein [Achromobacter aegrifaciens]WLW63589.1 fimbrial protein [Achromobacter aegrifaciens]